MPSRRKIIAGLGGLGVGSSLLYKRETVMNGGLEIVDYSTKTTILGAISYNIKVRNLNPVSKRSGKIIASAEFEDDSAISDSRKIEVDSLSTKSFELKLSPELDNRIELDSYYSEVYIENI